VGLHHSPHHLRRSDPHQPERRLVEEIAFRVLAADNQPNIRTMSDFRQDPFEDDGGTLRAGSEDRAGSACVKSGRVALDGTKINANAGKHKAMGYDRMKRKEKDLRSQIKDLLAQAEAADANTPTSSSEGRKTAGHASRCRTLHPSPKDRTDRSRR
jgi:hypothetical protein